MKELEMAKLSFMTFIMSMVFSFVVAPFLLLWAINTIGIVNVEYNLVNWLASIIIIILFSGSIELNTKHKYE